MSRRSDRPGRPVVGISCYSEPVDRTPWRAQPSVLVPADYTERVWEAGGTPVLLPPSLRHDAASVARVLDGLDAVIVAGGADVDADRYGANAHPSAQAPRPDRDHTELLLIEGARVRGMPLLGICRGMQLMAVAGGGTLEQHLPDRLGHHGHAPVPGVFGRHEVSVDPASVLGRLLPPRLNVASFHHQGVLTHPGYAASAWSDEGLLEGMEDAALPFCLGVQWHPEVDPDAGLFAGLVDAARR
jgi:putative glutamine amidotransferase